jgi:hypothetical protein
MAFHYFTRGVFPFLPGHGLNIFHVSALLLHGILEIFLTQYCDNLTVTDMFNL